MSAELVATVGFDGGVLRVLRAPSEVAITDASRAMRIMRPAQALELCALIDRATAVDAPTTTIGCVLMTNGRPLHVKRWPYAVGLSNHLGPGAHSGWRFRMRDQVEALRDALETAVGVEQTAPV